MLLKNFHKIVGVSSLALWVSSAVASSEGFLVEYNPTRTIAAKDKQELTDDRLDQSITSPVSKLNQTISCIQNLEIGTLIDLLDGHLREWQVLQEACKGILIDLKGLKEAKHANQQIRDHLNENPAYFPVPVETSWFKTLDDMTKNNPTPADADIPAHMSKETYEAMCIGVATMKQSLAEEDVKTDGQIDSLVDKYVDLVSQIQALRDFFNDPRTREAVRRGVSKGSQEVKSLKAKVVDLKRLSDDKARDLKELSFLQDDDRVRRIGARLTQEAEHLSQEMGASLRNRLILKASLKLLKGFPSVAHVEAAATGIDHALGEVMTDSSKARLIEALEVLSDQFSAEYTQIANNYIENNLRGFSSENFVRWVLVNNTHRFVPKLAKSAIAFARSNLAQLDPQMSDPLSIVGSKEAQVPVKKITTLHFPKDTELQRTKGRVAESLILVIKNLPQGPFIELIQEHVKTMLRDNDRKVWVQNLGHYYAGLGAEKLFTAVQAKVIDMIRQNSGDPSLLALSDETVEALLASRVADGDDQQRLIARINRLREDATTVMAAQLVELGEWEQKAPTMVNKLSSAVSKGISSTVGAVYSLTGYLWASEDTPMESCEADPHLDWQTRRTAELSRTKTLLLEQVQQWKSLRDDMTEGNR
jgi:hypothetical protein